MQIDFHHGVTYVVARLAGFDAGKANIIAHCAQYVDDATNDGIINFSNGASYARISSAHKTLDPLNVDQQSDRHVWVPFHFLPGNDGKPAGTSPPELDREAFVDRMLCRPNSPVAQAMVRAVIQQKDQCPYSLHRLGIAMHTYADTWAHQGFVGFVDKVNRASDIQGTDDKPDAGLISWLKSRWGKLVDAATGEFIADVAPVGHGAVLTYPDLPYLAQWGYTDGRGNVIKRHNTSDFQQAVRAMFIAMRRYVLGNPDTDVAADLAAKDEDFRLIDQMLAEIDNPSENDRHQRWLVAIGRGDFKSIGAETVTYSDKGEGSWKDWAISEIHDTHDIEEDASPKVYEYRAAFLDSDWKKFHDALQVQLRFVLTDLLPRFGLSAT